jgi:D-alanyl-D-alanine carboxypeptidase
MKVNLNNLVRAIAISAVVLFAACSKDDGAIPKNIGIEFVPAITTNLEKGGTADTIAFTNLAGFQGNFKVAMFFPDQKTPAKVDVVVRKNGAATNVKVYKADVSAFPASFTVTAAEIATLFGAPLALKDTYDFAPDIYVDAKKYQAFPLVGLGSGQGITGMSAIGYGEFVRYTVK